MYWALDWYFYIDSGKTAIKNETLTINLWKRTFLKSKIILKNRDLVIQLSKMMTTRIMIQQRILASQIEEAKKRVNLQNWTQFQGDTKKITCLRALWINSLIIKQKREITQDLRKPFLIMSPKLSHPLTQSNKIIPYYSRRRTLSEIRSMSRSSVTKKFNPLMLALDQVGLVVVAVAAAVVVVRWAFYLECYFWRVRIRKKRTLRRKNSIRMTVLKK